MVKYVQGVTHIIYTNMNSIMLSSLIAFLLIQKLQIAESRSIVEVCRRAAPWTLVPHEHQCEKFYVCTGDISGSYQEYSCPADYYFENDEQRCVPGTCYKQTVHVGCKAQSVERVLGDCRSYRQCTSGGVLVVNTCSSDSYFDVKARSCLPISITPHHQCSCLQPEYTTLPNPNDCETYYSCQSGQAVLQICPRDQYYNAELGSCILDTTGICLEHPTVPPTLSNEALALRECATTGSRLAPHSSDCSQYFVCATSRVIRLSCPKGQYFDLVKRYCTRDIGNKCQDKTKDVEKAQLPNTKLNEPAIKNELHLRPGDNTVVTEGKLPTKTPIFAHEDASSYDKLLSKFIPF